MLLFRVDGQRTLNAGIFSMIAEPQRLQVSALGVKIEPSKVRCTYHTAYHNIMIYLAKPSICKRFLSRGPDGPGVEEQGTGNDGNKKDP